MKSIRSACLLCLAFILASPSTASSASLNSLEAIQPILAAGLPTPEQQTAIREFFLKKYGQAELRSGTHRVQMQKLTDGGAYVGWFLQADPQARVIIVAEKDRRWPMIHVGEGYFARVERFQVPSSVHFRYDVNGKRLAAGRNNRFGFEDFPLTKDSLPQAGVPHGELIDMGVHVGQSHFPGAERHWWIYIPAQYRAEGPPAKLMVFNDGAGFAKGDGNAPIVFDNLIHTGRMPVTVGVFINPGEIPSKQKGRPALRNRGNEYDTCTPRYANFLEEEILPLVYAKAPNLSRKPEDHAICGSSSGASCAFTAAWFRPDLFQKVVSFVGSFCDFRPLGTEPTLEKNSIPTDEFGPWKTAHMYPGLLRKTNPPKPIKVFLQDGTNDLDNQLGNWFLNNQRMAAALNYGGYDYKFVPGPGMHSKKHGLQLLPEILEWLWKD